MFDLFSKLPHENTIKFNEKILTTELVDWSSCGLLGINANRPRCFQALTIMKMPQKIKLPTFFEFFRWNSTTKKNWLSWAKFIMS